MEDRESYCGVMTVEGEIIDQRFYKAWNDDAHLFPPFYCPDGIRWTHAPRWSPDRQHYFFWYYHQGQGISDLFLGTSWSNKIVFLGQFEDNYLKKIYPPSVNWLGNHHLYYFDASTKEITVINIDSPQKNRITLGRFRGRSERHYYPATAPSPSGERLVVQDWEEGADKSSTFYLIDVNANEKIDLTKELVLRENFQFDKAFTPLWSPDGSKFIIAGTINDKVAFIAFNQDGTFWGVLEGDEDVSFSHIASWLPNNDELLILCNAKRIDIHAGAYDLCKVKLDGTVERVFPYQNWTPQYWSTISDDGNYLYVLRKYTVFSFSADLYRLNLNTGVFEEVVKNIKDYNWIESSRFVEWSSSSLKWSPDKQWMILNNFGPDEKLPAVDKTTFTTALLCDSEGNCHEMKYDSLIIFGADWWQPPGNWEPGEPLEPFPDLTSGNVFMKDEFKDIDSTKWVVKGDGISSSVSKYGVGVKLDASHSDVSIESKFSINPWNGILFDFHPQQEAVFSCGLFNSRNNVLEIREPMSLVMGNEQGYVTHRLSLDRENATHWFTAFLRILPNNQLQVALIDKTYNQRINRVNIKLDSIGENTPYMFRCTVTNGTVEIDNFREIEFP